MKRDPEGSFVLAPDACVRRSRADALTADQKKRIASIVHTDCTLLPGSNFYTAAEFAIDAVIAELSKRPVEQSAAAPADERAESFDLSLASIDAHDPQSFIDGARWQKARAAASPAASIPIGYICADDLNELAAGNGAIISPKNRDTDVPVFASAAASPAAEAVAIPVEWDQDAAIEALSDFPKGSIWYEFLEEVGFDPTSGPIYVLTVQGRAMLDQLKSAYFATPQPPAQTDAREALADERYEAILTAAEDVLEYRKRVYAAGTNTEALARQAEKTLRFLLAAHPGQTGPRAEVANDEVVSACEAHGIALPVEALDAATALVNLFAARAGERQ
ncbi:hypothetical protein [Burkholderia ubonensis]|uniref:hypothetical protein n=1 Tax=Burkholderia ubonensis TaxID=101571 RepID=UPI000758B1B0|nr:hypothetical protein [Burkholderia ubonensis]KWC11440.1 hypothetical protein WL47_24715 [Burkholderia ubonensis]